MIKRSFQRVFHFLFQLQWKLTLAYTLVTVAVITILMVSTIFITGTMSYGMPQMALLLSESLNGATERLKPALQTNPPDAAGVRRWITSSITGNNLIFNNQDENGAPISMSYTSITSSETMLVVLDPEGRVLDSNHPEKITLGQFVPDEAAQGAAGLVKLAQQGEDSPARLLIFTKERQISLAPVREAPGGKLLGMALLVFRSPGVLELLWISLSSTVPAIGVLTIFAGLIGSLFGAVTARGLVRRLKSATRATSAWGEGDFSRRINDRSIDEIGQLSRDLDRMADHLQELFRARQELAAFEERNRLARELHDSAKQQVFATSMNLAAAKALWDRSPGEARRRVEVAAELSRQSQQELTTLIATLRPVQLEQQSLAQALRELAAAWERQHGIPVSCKLDGSPASLPPEAAQAVYRVAQEALSNAARHSGATQICLSLTDDHDQAAFEITDNGHGFDPNAPVRGLGLRSMQERISALGGSLSIATGPGGTTVAGSVPLAQPAPAVTQLQEPNHDR